MAFVKHKNIKFNQIRLIVGCEGFEINNEFIPKEIGFATENNFGVIKFRFENQKLLSYLNRKKNLYLINEHHGIHLNKNENFWPNYSHATSIIQSLYQTTESRQNPEKIYIAYNNDIHIRTLIHKAGLDLYCININDLFCTPLPSLTSQKFKKSYNAGIYKICDLHEFNLKNNFQCARSKVKLLFDLCIEKSQREISAFKK
jgi:hypothetical protein